MRFAMLLVVLSIGCGSADAQTPVQAAPDAGPVAPANIDGCWNYTAGAASGQMQVAGSTGTFTMTSGSTDHGQLFRADEPDGTFVILFSCQTAACGVIPTAGNAHPDTRFLFQVEGRDMASVTAATSGAVITFAATRC
jgi:hypothetical protein